MDCLFTHHWIGTRLHAYGLSTEESWDCSSNSQILKERLVHRWFLCTRETMKTKLGLLRIVPAIVRFWKSDLYTDGSCAQGRRWKPSDYCGGSRLVPALVAAVREHLLLHKTNTNKQRIGKNWQHEQWAANILEASGNWGQNEITLNSFTLYKFWNIYIWMIQTLVIVDLSKLAWWDP